MKEVFLKSETDGENYPELTIVHNCKEGRPVWNVAIFKIINVPDDVNLSYLKRLFDYTAIIDSGIIIDYNKLGYGKIIHSEDGKQLV